MHVSIHQSTTIYLGIKILQRKSFRAQLNFVIVPCGLGLGKNYQPARFDPFLFLVDICGLKQKCEFAAGLCLPLNLHLPTERKQNVYNSHRPLQDVPGTWCLEDQTTLCHLKDTVKMAKRLQFQAKTTSITLWMLGRLRGLMGFGLNAFRREVFRLMGEKNLSEMGFVLYYRDWHLAPSIYSVKSMRFMKLGEREISSIRRETNRPGKLEWDLFTKITKKKQEQN